MALPVPFSRTFFGQVSLSSTSYVSHNEVTLNARGQGIPSGPDGRHRLESEPSFNRTSTYLVLLSTTRSISFVAVYCPPIWTGWTKCSLVCNSLFMCSSVKSILSSRLVLKPTCTTACFGHLSVELSTLTAKWLISTNFGAFLHTTFACTSPSTSLVAGLPTRAAPTNSLKPSRT